MNKSIFKSKNFFIFILILILFLIFTKDSQPSFVIESKIKTKKGETFTIPTVPYPAPTIRMELNKESECIREKYIKLITSQNYHHSVYDNPPKLSKKIFTFKALKEGECRVNVIVFRVYSGFFSTHSHAFNVIIE